LPGRICPRWSPQPSLPRPRGSSLFLPRYAPELNPKENLWDEIREKIFKNYALKSMDAVYAKLNKAIGYINRNLGLVKSITSFLHVRSF
jgi:transposase